MVISEAETPTVLLKESDIPEATVLRESNQQR